MALNDLKKKKRCLENLVVLEDSSLLSGEADSKFALFYIEFITEKLLAYEETRAKYPCIKSTAIVLLSSSFFLKLKHSVFKWTYYLPFTQRPGRYHKT